MKRLLIGEAASDTDLERLRQAILEGPEVRRLIHMCTQHIGPDPLLLGARLEFDARLSFRELTDAIDNVEARIRAAVSSARIIYIEPDIYDPPQAT